MPANAISSSMKFRHAMRGKRDRGTKLLHPGRRRSAIYPAWRLPAEDCDDFLSSLRSRRARGDCAVVQCGGIQPKVAMASCHRRSRCATRENASEHQRALRFRRLASAS